MPHVVTMTFGHPSFFPSPGSLLNRNTTMRFNTGSIATLQWYIQPHNEYWWMKTNTCMGNLYSGRRVCNSRADDVSLRFFGLVCSFPLPIQSNKGYTRDLIKDMAVTSTRPLVYLWRVPRLCVRLHLCDLMPMNIAPLFAFHSTDIGLVQYV